MKHNFIFPHVLVVCLAFSLGVSSCSSQKGTATEADAPQTSASRLDRFAFSENHDNQRAGINCWAERSYDGQVSIMFSVTEDYAREEQRIDNVSGGNSLMKELRKLWFNAGVSSWSDSTNTAVWDGEWSVSLKQNATEEIAKTGKGLGPNDLAELAAETRRIFESCIAQNMVSLPKDKLTAFSYQISNGFANSSERFEAEVQSTGKIKLIHSLQTGENKSMREGSIKTNGPCIMEDLKDLINRKDAVQWKTHYDMLGVFDGSSWILNFAFGTTSFSSSGYMHGPKNYSEFVEEMTRIFEHWMEDK